MQPASYGSAVQECQYVGTPQGPGRRLPTHGELQAALARVDLAAGGELTSNVYPSSQYPGELDVLYVTSQDRRAWASRWAAEKARRRSAA